MNKIGEAIAAVIVCLAVAPFVALLWLLCTGLDLVERFDK